MANSVCQVELKGGISHKWGGNEAGGGSGTWSFGLSQTGGLSASMLRWGQASGLGMTDEE